MVRDDEQMEEDLLAAQRVKILEDRSTRLVERERLSMEDGGGREGELVKERLVGERDTDSTTNSRTTGRWESPQIRQHITASHCHNRDITQIWCLIPRLHACPLLISKSLVLWLAIAEE